MTELDAHLISVDEYNVSLVYSVFVANTPWLLLLLTMMMMMMIAEK